jgi:hypothetical protein
MVASGFLCQKVLPLISAWAELQLQRLTKAEPV